MAAAVVAPPPRDDAAAAGGPQPATLWRIRDRRTFAELRRRGARARRGSLTVTWLPADNAASPPRVAFGVPRGSGGAVLRNRVRRRLRAACRALRVAGRLPAGTYLLTGGADLADVRFVELVELVDATAVAARNRGAS